MPPDDNPLLNAALAFHHAGCSVVPARADGTKAPSAAWKPHQTTRPTPDELRHWLTGDAHDGIGVICGAVSGNLEMLELEGRAVAGGVLDEIAELAEGSGLGALWRRVTGGYLEATPAGGLHLLYRVNGPPKPNTKLARDPDGQVLVETRGEGGFTVVAPSGGRTHPTGKPWTLLAGSPATIPTLSVEQRDALHALAAACDRQPEPDPPSGFAAPRHGSGDGPDVAGDYNDRTTWEQLLTPRGWTLVTARGAVRYWRRPGKTIGVSATTGRNAGDNLYVFSTSTPFQPERPYSRFAAHAALEHGGDLSAAAKALYAAGYGTAAPAERALRLVHSTHAPGDVDGTSALAPAARTHEVTLTDDGNARLLVNEHHHHLRYVPEHGKWLTWAGHRWAWDDAGLVIEHARDTIHAIRPDTPDIARWRKVSMSRRAIEAMVALARSDRRVVVPAADLDANPAALCTPTGVIDLRTGQSRPADSHELHTRSTAVTAEPDQPTPRWDAFLAQTFRGHPELILFVQRLAGYSATGAVTHHVLPFLHGPGSNGKSVFLDVIRRVLGDYAATAPAGFLMAGESRHETEIARLTGLRFIICSEVNQDNRFDEAKIKLLTGGDALTARYMRQNHFTFIPTHHLWLMGNHQPRVSSGGNAFWRRLRLIPFTNTVPETDKIEGLDKILAQQEGPGILAWIIAGARKSYEKGLAEPAIVMAVTRAYADEEDALARFLDDCCHLGGGGLVKLDTAEFRREYVSWCHEQGEKELTPQVLGRELRDRFRIDTKRSNGHRHYLGITLLDRSLDGEDRQLHWSDR